jgi:hypothetical protein
MALQPLWSLSAFFSFLIYTINRIPWTRDQPVASPLPTYGTTHSSIILNPDTSRRWMVSLTPLPLCPKGNSRLYPLYRRLCGPQKRFGRCEEENLLPIRLLVRILIEHLNDLTCKCVCNGKPTASVYCKTSPISTKIEECRPTGTKKWERIGDCKLIRILICIYFIVRTNVQPQKIVLFITTGMRTSDPTYTSITFVLATLLYTCRDALII